MNLNCETTEASATTSHTHTHIKTQLFTRETLNELGEGRQALDPLPVLAAALSSTLGP
jgi:hypothetical protein